MTRASRNLPDLASVRRLWYGNEVMPSEPNGEGSGSVPGVNPTTAALPPGDFRHGRAGEERGETPSKSRQLGKSETGSRGDRRATVAREKVDRLATVQAIT